MLRLRMAEPRAVATTLFGLSDPELLPGMGMMVRRWLPVARSMRSSVPPAKLVTSRVVRSGVRAMAVAGLPGMDDSVRTAKVEASTARTLPDAASAT